VCFYCLWCSFLLVVVYLKMYTKGYIKLIVPGNRCIYGMFLCQRHWWNASGGRVLFHTTTQCFHCCAFVSLLKAACTTSLLVLKLQMFQCVLVKNVKSESFGFKTYCKQNWYLSGSAFEILCAQLKCFIKQAVKILLLY